MRQRGDDRSPVRDGFVAGQTQLSAYTFCRPDPHKLILQELGEKVCITQILRAFALFLATPEMK
jgi:hypothetical protein